MLVMIDWACELHGLEGRSSRATARIVRSQQVIVIMYRFMIIQSKDEEVLG